MVRTQINPQMVTHPITNRVRRLRWSRPKRHHYAKLPRCERLKSNSWTADVQVPRW